MGATEQDVLNSFDRKWKMHQQQYVQQAMKIIKARICSAKFMRYFSDSNAGLIYKAVYANDVASERRLAPDVIDDVIERCADGAEFRGNFIQIEENPGFREIMNAVYARFPRIGNNEANTRMICQFALDNVGKVKFSTQGLIDALTNNPALWNKLTPSEAEQNRLERERWRREAIAFLTNNGTSSFSAGTAPGRDGRQYPTTFDKEGYLIERSPGSGPGLQARERRIGGKEDKGFPDWTDEQLEFAVNEVKAKRETLQHKKDGTLGKHIDQTRRENMVERFHGDPYKTPQAMPTETTERITLIDPRNGNAITTRQQLISYITSSDEALARLVRGKNGITIAERSKEVDRLLSTR